MNELKLPQCSLAFTNSFNAAAQNELCLGMAGGREPERAWLEAVKQLYPLAKIYCADKGLAYCLQNSIVPDVVYGDADSAGQALFRKAQDLGVQVYTYPVEKDDTDLQLLLSKLPSCNLLISGVFGGRLDHLYSNIFSLLAMQDKQLGHIILADDKEILILLQAGDKLQLAIAKDFQSKLEAISLLPLAEAAEVSLSGVHWPLEKALLELRRPYAISNVPENGNELSCTCFKGKLGLYFSFR